MQGLTENTNRIFEALSKLNSIDGYILIGGTALSVQIGKRLSDDLDFCKWSTNLKTDKPTVDWPMIERELITLLQTILYPVMSFIRQQKNPIMAAFLLVA
jgi:hypothetical protein